VVVVEGPRHARVLGQLLLNGDADAALGKQALQLLKGLGSMLYMFIFGKIWHFFDPKISIFYA
jgi:hypothetical protein